MNFIFLCVCLLSVERSVCPGETSPLPVCLYCFLADFLTAVFFGGGGGAGEGLTLKNLFVQFSNVGDVLGRVFSNLFV